MVCSTRKQGFTILEILIFAAVVALLVLGGIASYRRFSEKQRVVQAAEDFVTQLRTVQKRADTGEMPAGCTGILSGYTIIGTAGSGTVDVKANCGSDIDIDSIVLKYGSTVQADATVKFFTATDGSTPTGFPIQVQSTDINYCVSLGITSGGAISIGTVVSC